MSNVNFVALMGRTTSDVEATTLSSGTKIAKVRLAENETYTNSRGEKVEHTNYFDLTAFGQTADTLARFVVKGQLIYVQGTIRFESWEDKQGGGKRSKHTIQVRELRLMPKALNPGQGNGKPAPKETVPPEEVFEDSVGSDIPF